MAKNTSITLGDHHETFIRRQIESGRYGNASEVIRAALRLQEDREVRIESLRRALDEGSSSGDAGELDFQAIRREAKRRAKSE